MSNDLARFLEDFERLEKQMPANDPNKLKRFVGAIGNYLAESTFAAVLHLGVCRGMDA
jgi:hypothetical protein